MAGSVLGPQVPRTGGYTVRTVPGEADPRRRRGPVAQGRGMWNTFISCGLARLFWRLAQCHLAEPTPSGSSATRPRSTRRRDEALHAAYYGMANRPTFIRSVLSNADELAVLPVAGSGWWRLGLAAARCSPGLAGTDCHARLVARMGERGGRGQLTSRGAVRDGREGSVCAAT